MLEKVKKESILYMVIIMKEKIDLRVQKTKKNIYESFVRLLEVKPFENIRVAEICEKSMINRSTFYAHFDDKYMLLDSFAKDLKKGLKGALDQNQHYTNSKEYFLRLLELLLLHIESEKDIYRAVMQNNRNSIAMDMIYDALKEDIEKRLKKEQDFDKGIPTSFVSSFYLGAIFNIGMDWMFSKNKLTKEEILTYLDQLIVDDFF